MLEGTKRVRELFEGRSSEFQIFIIEGWNGVGKTAYANNIIAETYTKPGATKGNWEISNFRKHLGFHPMRVTQQWYKMKQRDYCYHWDDSGAWLHSLDFNDPFVKRIGKYLQTARTDWGCLMFTCIDADDLAKKIRGLSSAIKIKITKNTDGSHPWRRIATAKHAEKDWYGHIFWVDDWKEEFNCRMPEPFYSTWYVPLRKKYAKTMKGLAKKAAAKDIEIYRTYKESPL